jgi:hypothetical protein
VPRARDAEGRLHDLPRALHQPHHLSINITPPPPNFPLPVQVSPGEHDHRGSITEGDLGHSCSVAKPVFCNTKMSDCDRERARRAPAHRSAAQRSAAQRSRASVSAGAGIPYTTARTPTNHASLPPTVYGHL